MWNAFTNLIDGARKVCVVIMFIGFSFLAIKYNDMYMKICTGLVKMVTDDPNYVSFSGCIITVIIFLIFGGFLKSQK